MESYLANIDRLNPTFNAIVSLRHRDELLSEAAQRDSELAKGIYHGWMHGFHHAVKDLAATDGIPTTMGSPLLANDIPRHDAIFVERLKQAGAIIIGKTNTPEFGLGSQTYNKVFGTTYNAYNPKCCAGGSSGGAAVALATRMLPVADGSDMMGSLRNPAAFNNVFGFRPSFGRVPFGPTQEIFSQQLGYEGPMGRTVRDTAMLLSTMAGFDSRIPLSIKEDPLQLPLVIWENHNVRVDIFYQGYRPEKKRVLDRFGLAFLLFPSTGYAAYTTWQPMLNSWRLLESSPTLDGLPGYFILKTILFSSFASISLISLVLAIKKRPWVYRKNSE